MSLGIIHYDKRGSDDPGTTAKLTTLAQIYIFGCIIQPYQDICEGYFSIIFSIGLLENSF